MPEAIESLWQELCSAFPGNLRYCLRYILVVCGLSPQTLLCYVSIARVTTCDFFQDNSFVVSENRIEIEDLELSMDRNFMMMILNHPKRIRESDNMNILCSLLPHLLYVILLHCVSFITLQLYYFMLCPKTST